MASACVNNIGIVPSENFLDCSPAKRPSYGWLSPRVALGRDFPGSAAKNQAGSSNAGPEDPKSSDPETSGSNFMDFEFRLVDPVNILPADELFSDGKLVPLQILRSNPASSDIRSGNASGVRRRNEISPTDPYLFSPKAPRCTTRWKEILGLKKLHQHNNENRQEPHKTTSSSAKSAGILKQFLHRGSNSKCANASIESSLNLPLLNQSDNDSLSLCSRLSLSSSSSSGHDYDDLPRLSLDSDYKPNSTILRTSNLSKVRVVKHRSSSTPESQTVPLRPGRSPMRRNPESRAPVRGVSVDSPRMNSSGKIVFHGLERSSSSPSTFNGGPPKPYKSRGGMERSYSANVRVAPVLNVPVFGLFSSSQKKDNGNGNGVGGNRIQPHHNKNRTDRT